MSESYFIERFLVSNDGKEISEGYFFPQGYSNVSRGRAEPYISRRLAKTARIIIESENPDLYSPQGNRVLKLVPVKVRIF